MTCSGWKPSPPCGRVYRLQHWLGDAETAELYLWSPSRDAAILTSAIDHASTLGITALTTYACGEAARCLADLGAEIHGPEHVLARPNP